METIQVKNIKQFLEWLSTCQSKYTVSSMQGGFIHVKFFIDGEKLNVSDVDKDEVLENG